MKQIKIVSIIFIGLVIWGIISWLTVSFMKAEINPFAISQGWRGVIVFSEICYLCFVPFFYMILKDEIK